jgi:hypothetical protein
MSTFLALPTSADTKGTPNSNASGYWNEERRNNAIPREFQFEVGATEGKLTPQARRVSNGGGTNYPSGTTVKWSSADKLEAKLTGKIFFTMAKQDYVCSGSLINDGNTSIDIVVTAAHCVWNNSKNPSQSGFASNWTFYPNYFTTLKTNGVPASLLFAPSEFTKQTTFNTVATLNDFAFAVLPSNIFPDDSKPSVAPASGGFLTSVGNAFGYPQASPYDGQFLYRSYGEISEDANNGKKTWRIPSDMTGGASGGPWYEGYKEGETLGTNVSVNSYKYSGDTKGMYGPKFSQLTIDVLTQAKTNSCPNSSSLISCRKL